LRKILFAFVILIITSTVAAATVFPDVPKNHPNAIAIDFLTTEKIINGYPDGNFKPDQIINRAEALKIILLSSNVEIPENFIQRFPDFESTEWFAKYVATANKLNIIDGYPDGTFQPENPVNKAETLKMILQTNLVELINYETNKQIFADTKAGAWFTSFLNYAKKFELVEADKNNNIYPADNLTRGELSEIIYRFQTRVDHICPRLLENSKTITKDYFEGITLDNPLPNVFYENEIYLLSGQTLENSSIATVFFSDETGTQTVFSGEIENNKFAIPVEFRKPQLLNFSVLPKSSGKSVAASIEILPRECQPAVILTPSTTPQNLHFELKNNQSVFKWENFDNNLTRFVLRQNERRFERLLSVKQNSFQLNPLDFIDWEKGSASLQIFSARSENGFSFEPRTKWQSSTELTLQITQHHFSEFRTDELELNHLPIFRSHNLTITGTTKIPLESNAFLIEPNGQVIEIPIQENLTEIPAQTEFSFELELPQTGIYFLEINDLSGLAVLNHPLYEPNTIPLLPDFMDLRELSNSKYKILLNHERLTWLRLINNFRAQHQLPKVTLNSKISEFAQNYAEEMMQKDFFAHVDLNGKNPDERRRIFGLNLPVGENIARDLKVEYAHAGLLRSAAHRQNIMQEKWSQIGLGIAETEAGDFIFVQEFSVAEINADNLAEIKTELLNLLNKSRAAKNLPLLTMDFITEKIAQNWSEKMVTEKFFALEIETECIEPDNSLIQCNVSLENELRIIEEQSNFFFSVAGAGEIARLAEIFLENKNSPVFGSGVESVGIGLVQNSDGMIVVTLIWRMF
jgi:uncharacterized protein YkwD